MADTGCSSVRNRPWVLQAIFETKTRRFVSVFVFISFCISKTSLPMALMPLHPPVCVSSVVLYPILQQVWPHTYPIGDRLTFVSGRFLRFKGTVAHLN